MMYFWFKLATYWGSLGLSCMLKYMLLPASSSLASDLGRFFPNFSYRAVLQWAKNEHALEKILKSAAVGPQRTLRNGTPPQGLVTTPAVSLKRFMQQLHKEVHLTHDVLHILVNYPNFGGILHTLYLPLSCLKILKHIAVNVHSWKEAGQEGVCTGRCSVHLGMPSASKG